MIEPHQIENVTDLETYLEEKAEIELEERKKELVSKYVNEEDFRGYIDEITHEIVDADMIRMSGMTDYGRLYDLIKDYNSELLIETGANEAEEQIKGQVFYGLKMALREQIKEAIENLPDEEKVPEAL